MKYRADIDGLRALAILFVLVFHGGLQLFPSGFIGVDIFFVISGFLITGILHNSLENNRFSFAQFYSRRLWRLQPVFICLLVMTAIMTLLFYLPEDLLQYSKSARKTSLFISNNFFERATTGYFSPKNSIMPLLHTWSLSIEWQCYLILPVVLFLLHRFVNKKYIKPLIYVATLCFFALTMYFSAVMPSKTYYQLASRLFEFLLGSCVVLSQFRLSLNKYAIELLNITALTIIFYIATRTDIHLGFPNWYALLLGLATAILIATGMSHPQSKTTQLLSFKPLVFIGLLSYSLYIWHWPVLALVRYLGIQETNLVLTIAFTIIVTLAYISWRFVEKPARQYHSLQFSYTLALLIALPVALIHITDITIRKHQGYPHRFDEAAHVVDQLYKFANKQRPLCLDEKNMEVSQNCVLGAKNQAHNSGFLFGDSYSNQYWGFIETFAKEANVSLLAHGTIACLALPDVPLYDWKAEVYTACQEQTKRYYQMIQQNHYDMVILGENWDGYLSRKKLIGQGTTEDVKKRIETALDKALSIITAAGSKPFIIKSVATGDAYNCFFQHIKLRQKYNPNACDFSLSSYDHDWQDSAFARLQKKYPQLVVIDPKQAQCPKGVCKADINGVPLFRDTQHISDYGSYQLAKNYLKSYKNPLIG